MNSDFSHEFASELEFAMNPATRDLIRRLYETGHGKFAASLEVEALRRSGIHPPEIARRLAPARPGGWVKRTLDRIGRGPEPDAPEIF